MPTAGPMVTITVDPTSEPLNPLVAATSSFSASGVPSKVTGAPTPPAASVVPGFDPQSGIAPRYGKGKRSPLGPFSDGRDPAGPMPTHTQSFNSNLMPPTPSPGASNVSTDGSTTSTIANHIGEIQMSGAAQLPDPQLRKVRFYFKFKLKV